MNTDLRVGVIGAGYFARFQIEAWQRLSGADLVALCDLDAEKLLAASTIAPHAANYTDAAAMLDECALDIVDIATPPSSHYQLVELCAQRKLNTICQKPLAPSYSEAVEIVQLAEQAAITLAVHENFRFMPWHQEAACLIAADYFGQLHSISMRLRPGDGQGPQAYLGRQPYFQTMERFLVHETLIHFIDTFRFLCGEVSGVFARLKRLNPFIKGEDAGYIILDFNQGMTGLIDGNRLNEHEADNMRRTMGELWLEGENGVLRLNGYGQLFFKPHGKAEKEHAYAWQDIGFAGDCVYQTQAHLLAHFKDGEPLQNSAADYLRNMLIEETVYQSAQQGQWLPV